MARIKIDDLPKDMKISKEEMKRITGGTIYAESEITNIAGDNLTYDPTYLELQQKIQAETREYTMLSNIMKVKQDTAQNSINNIR